MALDPRARQQFQQLRSQRAQGGQLDPRQQQRFNMLSQQRQAQPPSPPPQAQPQPSRGQLAGQAMGQLASRPPLPPQAVGGALGTLQQATQPAFGGIDPFRNPQGQDPAASNWGAPPTPTSMPVRPYGGPNSGGQWGIGFNGFQQGQQAQQQQGGPPNGIAGPMGPQFQNQQYRGY